MSKKLHFKLTANALLVLILIQILFLHQEVAGQFMMSRFHVPRQSLEDQPQKLNGEMMDIVIPIYEHDRQRLKFIEANKSERLGKVRRDSKNVNCILNASDKGASGGRTGADCSGLNEVQHDTDKPLPLDDIKRMILRIEAMLDKLIVKGYVD